MSENAANRAELTAVKRRIECIERRLVLGGPTRAAEAVLQPNEQGRLP
ncbi:MAG: hypothetical protein LJE69_00935 [Thiohalocapsa sp.]|jgi:hypothetical protein|nr:hypothetical protein [Thiohalocapsa sp.]MCG6939803.1 hypothetical protein [Thiohalocapsa sp.]